MAINKRRQYVNSYHRAQDSLYLPSVRAYAKELKRVATKLSSMYDESHGSTDVFGQVKSGHEEELVRISKGIYKACVKRFWLFGITLPKKLKSTKSASISLDTAPFETQLEWDVFMLLVNNVTATMSGIADVTIETATKAAAAGLAAGLTQPQIAKKIHDEVGGVQSRWRADLIARTEIHKASNLSTYHSVKSTVEGVDGIKVQKEWISTNDSRVRDNHRQADGQRVIIDGKFKIGRDLMSHPGDPLASAANVCNCRCVVGYDIIED